MSIPAFFFYGLSVDRSELLHYTNAFLNATMSFVLLFVGANTNTRWLLPHFRTGAYRQKKNSPAPLHLPVYHIPKINGAHYLPSEVVALLPSHSTGMSPMGSIG